MRDRTFEEAVKDWKTEFFKWENGERPNYCSEDSTHLEYWEWDGHPPDREYYRPYKDEDATWFQVYETVSEGTPVTPPFATEEDLIDYLTKNGDFWDQKRGDKPYSREQYQKFVYGKYAPSFVFENGVVKSGIESL